VKVLLGVFLSVGMTLGCLVLLYAAHEVETHRVEISLWKLDHDLLMRPYEPKSAEGDYRRLDTFREQWRDWARLSPKHVKTRAKQRRFERRYESVASGCDSDGGFNDLEALRAYESALFSFRDALERVHDEETRPIYALSCALIVCATFSTVLLGSALLRASSSVREHRKRSAVAEADQHAIVHGMGVAALVLDENERVVDANVEALAIFGVDDRGQLLAKSVEDYLTRYPPAKPAGTQFRGSTRDGRQLVVNLSSSSSRTTLVIQDVTDEYDIQQKVLSQFVHEIRNKYTSAAAMLERLHGLADSTASDAEVRAELRAAQADIVTSSALLHEADQLVQTRLNLHKMAKGAYQSRLDTVDLFQLLSDRARAAAALGYEGVDFVVELSPQFRRATARLDLYVFTHIATHLLHNARKHTTRGSVAIALVRLADDGQLVFAVRDTGQGLAESISSRLFNEQVASADCRGVGLGLASCAQFAGAVGGACWLESTKLATPDDPNSGSDFRFSMPGTLTYNAAASSSSSEAAARPDAKFLRTLSLVVICEDSDLIRKALKAKLRQVCRRAGATDDAVFREFETVETLLPHLPEFAHRPDCLVTIDQNLDAKGGVLSGTDLALELNKAAFRGLMLSCSGDDAAAAEHARLGCLVLGKPIPKVDDLLHKILDFAAATQRRRPAVVSDDSEGNLGFPARHDAEVSPPPRRQPLPSTREPTSSAASSTAASSSPSSSS